MLVKRPLGIFITLVAFLVMANLNTKAQSPNSGDYYQLSDFPFVFVSDKTTDVPFNISDSLFDAVAQGIRFKVNRTELQPSEPFVSLYRHQLVPWLKSHDMELRQVYVKGAASPEGPYNNNVRLSRERTQRLIQFMNAELGDVMPLRPIDAKSITEDYGLLVRMMHQANDADYEKVNAIWLSCKGDEACCKQRLMALEKGRVWKRLSQKYFPSLRQARVVLLFARKSRLEPAGQYSFAETTEPEMNIPHIEQPIEYYRRHLIAARTNLLHDFLYVPQFGFAPGFNIQLEYYPLRGHFTYNVGFTFISHRRWSEYKFFQIRDLRLELRRYFIGGGKFKGPYLGAYAEGTVYGIGFNRNKGWEGEGGGGGVSLGYTFALNRKGNLRMELSASFGMFYTRHDPYIYGDPFTGEEDGLYYYDYHGNSSDFKERNHQWTWFGPTNAGIHITYDIIYRKKQPRYKLLQEGGSR